MSYNLVVDYCDGKRYRGFNCDMACEHLSTNGHCCYLYSKRLAYHFAPWTTPPNTEIEYYERCEECIEFDFPRREDEE